MGKGTYIGGNTLIKTWNATGKSSISPKEKVKKLLKSLRKTDENSSNEKLKLKLKKSLPKLVLSKTNLEYLNTIFPELLKSNYLDNEFIERINKSRLKAKLRFRKSIGRYDRYGKIPNR